ncbi:MAG: hypothetical protein EOO68_25200, partial [Moraxellaceae bacterium]
SMLAFGVGTLPAVLAAGVAAQQLAHILQQRRVRTGMAVIIIVFGIWTIWGSLGHSHSHGHHESMQEPQMDHQDHSHMHHSTNPIENVDRDAASVDHSAMDHTHHSSTLERQRTDSDSKLEDDKSSASSSIEAGDTTVNTHHHE